MHQELIDVLLSFAIEHNLYFDYGLNEDEKIYYFVFQNQERTWVYSREISQEQLDLFNGPTVFFAYDLIDTLKRKRFF